ncbi:hypothetical protein GCM10027591_06310 [Zhihengliuella somnathii]
MSTVTDAAGAYSFTALELGDYIVEFVAPEGAAFTLQAASGDDATDSDADQVSGQSGVVTLTADVPAVDTVDAGLVQVLPAITVDPGTVAPGDVTSATGSGYFPNSTASVQLVDPAGAPVGDPISVPTDENGAFVTDVPVPADAAPGDYTVVGTDDLTTLEASAPLTVTEGDRQRLHPG